jgi:hypothetical protein
MDTKYYLLHEAADLLKCMPYKITYLLSTQQVQEPIRIGGRRVFDHEDLVALAEIINPGVLADLKKKEARHA